VHLNRQELSWLLAAFREGRISEEAVVSRLQSDGSEPEVPAERRVSLLTVLDQFRAAEESGAETLRKWALLTESAYLVGGLRAAAAREAQHALLLDQRLRELGGVPRAEIPHWLRRLNAEISDPATEDAVRLAIIVRSLPDADRIAGEVNELTEAAGDPLTTELLRNICADDLVTFRWFVSAHHMIGG
jgi:hypothetical protein